MASKDYEVGYKKPPKNTQFQPGQSGNPNGRPKGTQNLATDLEEELSAKIMVTEGGNQQQITKQRAMLKTLFAKALKGETRAANVLINLIIGLEPARSMTSDSESLSDEDQAILESYQQQLVNKLKSD